VVAPLRRLEGKQHRVAGHFNVLDAGIDQPQGSALDHAAFDIDLVAGLNQPS
jgi:hypothetical protein